MPEPLTGRSQAELGPPDTAELADAAAAWPSAYVHIPFCRRRCPYCDFAVVTPDEGASDEVQNRYLDALVAEIGMEPPWQPLAAVNFGGGTPSAVPVPELAKVLGALDARFGLEAHAEVSLEANPEDWQGAYADAARAAGFTRVSLGVQSFDQAVLNALGRRHTPDEADHAVRSARAAGFVTVSVDLIFGTPGETPASWRRTVERAVRLEPDHLSAYALTVERGTALSRAVGSGAPGPDPDDQADKYDMLLEVAGEAGLVQYEVSNFARPGHACRYNLATWAQGEYLAFGVGAHGHRRGVRRRNLRRLDRYLESVAAGNRPEAGSEILEPWDRELERLFLGLRRVAGVTAGRGGEAFASSPAGTQLIENGIATLDDDRVRIVRPLLSDAVNRVVLDLPPLSVSPRDC
jgi:oxygen-independent coproporphyrinogen-3 oxidase